MFSLSELAEGFVAALTAVDAQRPIARNVRSGKCFQPGIGPHSESAAVALILKQLSRDRPGAFGTYVTSVNYPGTRQKCDACFGSGPTWDWAVEIKLVRFAGDNDKPNDNMLMHLLSPYPEHRSALTDLEKLRRWVGPHRKAILIYGFDHERWPLEPAIDAFEVLARSRARVSSRVERRFSGLVHPVHASGAVVTWELLG